MTIDSFNHLSFYQQDQEIIKHGIHLLDYDQENIAYEVYKLYGFYVKLRYEYPKQSEPVICTFTSSEVFQLYENHIFALIGAF